MNPLNPEVSMQELQARVAQLEHENAALRSSENRDRLWVDGDWLSGD